MIISRTPVRISFFGGGTDYREYYLRNGGAVLGTTIDKHVYVSINRLSDFFEYKIRVGYSKSELVNDLEDIQHPSVRESLRFMGVDGNLDIHIFADLPARTGLGSSSSFTVGFLNALHALEGRMASPDQLAREAMHVEQDLIAENVGSQDQAHAAFGGLNVIEFFEDRVSVKPLVITAEKRQLLEDSLMIFYTGQTRYASEILRTQVQKTRSKANDEYLGKMHEKTWEAVRLISDEEPARMLEGFGRLLHESWEIKKTLSDAVSTSLIDKLYATSLAAGAFGGKVAGAGGGGFVMLIVAPEKQPRVRAALADYLEVDFKFDQQGSSIIYLR